MDSRERASYETPKMLRWRQRTDWPLMVLAVASLPVLLLEIDKGTLQESDQRFIDAVNWLVLVAFATDYLVELALATQRRKYIRHEWASLLIVIAQAVALVPSLTAFGVLRAARAARLLRFFALAARAIVIGGTATKQGRRLLKEHAGALALGLAGFTWLMSAAAFTIAENGRRDVALSFADGLWWAAATITTVGYGDVYPVTPVGRIIGGFTMVVGISTFALVTAKIAQFLVLADKEDASMEG